MHAQVAEDHRNAAIHAIAADRYDRAGDRYTLAAYTQLSGHGGSHAAFDPAGGTDLGAPLSSLALASVCYRLAGTPDRSRARARSGLALATEHRDHVLTVPEERAACTELAGDFHHLLEGRERARAAYGRASEGYQAADLGNPAGFTARRLLEPGTRFLVHLSRPDDLTWDEIHGSDPERALSTRLRFKSARLASLLAARFDAGDLMTPRGSTEYGTGRFDCPACGSSDVNYVAGAVFCLRCDTPIEGGPRPD
jgi:hypothetical protein